MNTAQALFADRLRVAPTSFLDGRLIQCAAHQVEAVCDQYAPVYLVRLDKRVPSIPPSLGTSTLWAIEDGDTLPLHGQLHGLVYKLASYVGRQDRVVVACHMGINRSSLVVALILRKVLGCSGREAVAMVKEARPDTFSNKTFLRYVEGLPK